jgi:hypothetical protein
MLSIAERAKMLSEKPQFEAPLEKCPYAPAAMLPFHHFPAVPMPLNPETYAGHFSHPAGVAQTESKLRIARDRARGKRGPPEPSLL